ncbi:MAG: L-serine ammonia-lyase, partial [Betaproteobacteria bacterium]|nr:L-serine ammonia-lyase [Betaproteobacteria bacterium]
MALSVFDLFKIGIGPSSSHTVGPMKAAAMFVRRLAKSGLIERTARVETRLYGSLGATGKGHGTDTAVMLGLEGAMPDSVDPDSVDARLQRIRAQSSLLLDATHAMAFHERDDILFLRRESLPFHSNGLRFFAYSADASLLEERRYFSVGGGFVVSQEEADASAEHPRMVVDPTVLQHPFSSGDELLAITNRTGLSIAQVMRRNEQAWRSDAELDAGLDRIWDAMKSCVERGCRTDGHLPGAMRVKRRAAEIHRSLSSRPEQAP